jgi:hypothetical protein
MDTMQIKEVVRDELRSQGEELRDLQTISRSGAASSSSSS